MDSTSKFYLFVVVLRSFIFGLVLSIFLNGSAKQEEIKKAWGIENYNKLVELFETDAYKAQQARAIGNFEAQLVELDSQIKSDSLPTDK